MKTCVVCETKFDSISWKCPLCGYAPELISGFLSFVPELAEANDAFNPDFLKNSIISKQITSGFCLAID